MLDGKKISHTSLSTPKNLGKTNETSAKEQAISEALSKVQLKIREGYFLTKKEAEDNEVIKPMLAKSIENELDKVEFPCYIQPKLDGVRALKKRTLFKSRKNTVIDTMVHMQDDLKDCGFILDGELYAHGVSFQENMKLIKKLREDTVNVKFHVYDIISDEPYSERLTKLESLLENYDKDNIQLVPTYIAYNEEDFKKYHDLFISQGYEGAMIRHGKDGYKKNGRSSSLLKFKEFIDRAYTLIDITPARKNKKHGVPVVKVNDKLLPLTTPKIEWYKEKGKIYSETVDGVECGYPTTRCGTKLSHEDREDLLTNRDKYLGKTAEIRFFEFYDSGVPRFPIFYGFRIDK